MDFELANTGNRRWVNKAKLLKSNNHATFHSFHHSARKLLLCPAYRCKQGVELFELARSGTTDMHDGPDNKKCT